jgi:pimeloyl-ACP methyl ester carboxylesterase
MYKAALRLSCFFVFLTGTFVGTSFAAPSSAAPASHEKVYLLRGFMNVFSLGMDQLASELERRGVSATVGNHLVSSSFASDAIQACKSGQINSIVIIGHSLGASAAVSMAEEMQKAGVRVALIIMFDPVVRTAVPPNVQRLKNFYFSNGVGEPVARGEHFHGMLQNVDLKDNPQLRHVSLAYSSAIHKQVLSMSLRPRISTVVDGCCERPGLLQQDVRGDGGSADC